MRTFRREMMDNECGPQPSIQPDELPKLTDDELASYIAAGTYDFDGIGGSLREAVVRLLRRSAQIQPVDPFERQKS
jgi:hypothetical protein